MTERIPGKVTGISGPMYSGKTAELLELATRAKIAGRKVQLFKPSIDNRWGKLYSVRSHSGAEMGAIPISEAAELFRHLQEETDLVGIDEIQFMQDMIPVVLALASMDKEVIFAGLRKDFRDEPFGDMPELLARADFVINKTAICTHSTNGDICGEEATRTQRFVDGKPAHYNDPVIVVGAEEKYAARCPRHHIVQGRPSGTIYEAIDEKD